MGVLARQVCEREKLANVSLQLADALYPLIRMTGDKQLMGPFVNRLPTRLLAWFLFAVISGANAWLIGQWLF